MTTPSKQGVLKPPPNRLFGQRQRPTWGAPDYQPNPMCSGKYTAMPTTMVPSTACPWPRRQK